MYAKIELQKLEDLVALALTAQQEAILFYENSRTTGLGGYFDVSSVIGDATLLFCQVHADTFAKWRAEERPDRVSLFEGRVGFVT
jgi:rubrerythrin